MDIASLLKGISGFVWIAVFGVLALVVMRAVRKTPLKKGKSLVLTLLIIAVVLTTVSSGRTAVASSTVVGSVVMARCGRGGRGPTGGW